MNEGKRAEGKIDIMWKISREEAINMNRIEYK